MALSSQETKLHNLSLYQVDERHMHILRSLLKRQIGNDVQRAAVIRIVSQLTPKHDLGKVLARNLHIGT